MYLLLDPPGKTLSELAWRQGFIFFAHQLEARLVTTTAGTADRCKKHGVVETAGDHVASHEEGGIAIEEGRPMAAIARNGLLIGG